MLTRVFYSSWQLQCCGDPFAVGDEVAWTASEADSDLRDQLGSEGHGVEWLEDHHAAEGEETASIAGRVLEIRALWQKYEQSDAERNVLTPVHGALLSAALPSANGWESESIPLAPDFHFDGYLVTLA